MPHALDAAGLARRGDPLLMRAMERVGEFGVLGQRGAGDFCTALGVAGGVRLGRLGQRLAGAEARESQAQAGGPGAAEEAAAVQAGVAMGRESKRAAGRWLITHGCLTLYGND